MSGDITEIVITGGPAGGKSTSLSALSAKLTDWGFRPLIVPELATILIGGGLQDIGAIAGRDFDHFLEIETRILHMQRNTRLQYLELARTFTARGEKVVIIYDRGESDIAAYIGARAFGLLCEEAGLSTFDVRDSYDSVIHLVTAAIGAEHAYTTANNAARRETVAEAAELDGRTLQAWQGHPHLRVIDNSTDFETKIGRVLTAIARVLGIPDPLEIERKFVLDQVPDQATLDALGAVAVEIEQTYLVTDGSGSERRLRRRGPVGAAAYYLTEKRRLDDITRIERERILRPREYLTLLAEDDPERAPIRKVRHHMVYGSAYLELDIYERPAGLCTVEIELVAPDQETLLPPELGAHREVSGDPDFDNASLARAIA